MNLLLDTHAFIWWIHDSQRLPESALAAIRGTHNSVLLSLASIWEMQIKYQLVKLQLNVPLQQIVEEQQARNGLQLLSITPQHIYTLGELPQHHRDPFDRLLIARLAQCRK